MRKLTVGLLAAGTMLAVAMPTAAQTRPNVSGSESSRRSEPTCVVNGYTTNCEGEAVGGVFAQVPGPIIAGSAPVFIPAIGGATDGRAGTDTDVDRSTRNGVSVAR